MLVWHHRSQSPGPRVPRTWLSLALLGALAGCHTPPPVKPADPEGVIRLDHGNASLALGGRTLEVRAADGSALADLGLVIGGKVYRMAGGKLALPPDALDDAKRAGGLVVLAPGFVPGKLALGGDGSIALVRAGAPRLYPDADAAGGPFATADGRVEVTLPPGLLPQPTGNVTLATYAPPTGADSTTELAHERQGLPSATGCDAPWPCGPIDASLGVEIVTNGTLQPGQHIVASYDLDAMLAGWNGEAPAPWLAHPEAWSPEARQEATAAARILAAFKRLDAYPADRQALADRYGLVLTGHTLGFTVTLDSEPAVDGLALIEVAGSDLLGVRLEVTMVGASGGNLDPAAQPAGAGDVLAARAQLPAGVLPGPDDPAGLGVGAAPGTNPLISQDGAGATAPGATAGLQYDEGGNPISQDGADLISQDGAGLAPLDARTNRPEGGGNLISQDGGGVVSNDGGSLVSNAGGALGGALRVPFEPPNAKYALAQVNVVGGLGQANGLAGQGFNDYVWPNAEVAVLARPGLAFSPIVKTDATGRYQIAGMGATPHALFVKAVADNYELYTIATAPGGKLVAGAGIDAATSLLAAWTLHQLKRRSAVLAEVNVDNFIHEAAQLRPMMNQQDARDATSGKLDDVASQASAFFRDHDFHPHTLTPVAVVSTLAGAGPTARGLVDGQGAAARFAFPVGLARGPAGELYVGDYANHAIRRVAADGNVTTLTPAGFAPNPPAASRLAVASPAGLTRGQDGTLYVSQEGGPWGPVNTVSRIGPTFALGVWAGILGVVPGQLWADGTGAGAHFHAPYGSALDAAGNLYVADVFNHRIRKIAPNGLVTTVAGSTPQGQLPFGGGLVDGPLAGSKLRAPWDVAFDPTNGTLVVADAGNNCIRRIDLAAGTITTIAGSTAGQAGLVNERGTKARFSAPEGVAVGPDGTIYVSDTRNQRIRMIMPNGFVRTLAGSGNGTGGYKDGHGAHAKFYWPQKLVVDNSGTVYVTDYVNACIRKIER